MNCAIVILTFKTNIGIVVDLVFCFFQTFSFDQGRNQLMEQLHT
jgi:hypothetical protein